MQIKTSDDFSSFTEGYWSRNPVYPSAFGIGYKKGMGGDIVWIKINISNNFGTAAVFMDALKLESSKNVNRLINLQQTERILNNYFYPYLMEPGHDNITALKSVKKVIEENQRYKGIIAIYFDEKYKDNQSSDHCTRTFASSI